jgi:hypothetical protein
MILVKLFIAWIFFAIIGLILFELRPDKEKLYIEFLKLKATTRFKYTFPIALFIYAPFSIVQSLRKILEKR